MAWTWNADRADDADLRGFFSWWSFDGYEVGYPRLTEQWEILLLMVDMDIGWF